MCCGSRIYVRYLINLLNMAHTGQELFNPITRQTTVFHQTAADTDGALLQVEWGGGPQWTAGPKHVHRLQEERFTVLEGRASSHVAGEERDHAPGDVFTAPAGSVHTVWNAGDGDIRLLVEFRPALRSETILELLVALAEAGRTRRDGVPRNIFDLAILVRDYEDEIYPVKPPLAIQHAVVGPLAWLGRRLGYAERLRALTECYKSVNRGSDPLVTRASVASSGLAAACPDPFLGVPADR